MEFIKAIETTALPANKMTMVTISGKEILIANVDGVYHAIANKCTHSGGSLTKGTLNDCNVTCPKHGAQFDVRNGKAVGEAKIAFMKIKVNDEASYTVKVEGTSVLVGIP